MCAINPGHGETSPESGDILAVPDIVSNLFGAGGQICHVHFHLFQTHT